MACSNCKNKENNSDIESLPYELQTKILTKVSASSSTDIFNAKFVSKSFNRAAGDDYVFKNISVEKFPLVNWETNIANEAAFNSFWERCLENENPDALFRQGVVYNFRWNRKENTRHEFLKKAADLGHYGALYTLAMLLLLSENDELKKQGVRIVGDIKKSNVTLKECREKLGFILGEIWLTDEIVCQKFITHCPMSDEHRQVSRWGSNGYDIQCDAYQCEEEFAFFCPIFSLYSMKFDILNLLVML